MLPEHAADSPMSESRIGKAVLDYIEDHSCAATCYSHSNLSALGLDRHDLEELLFRLEDRFQLTAAPRQEDQLLRTATTVEDLIVFLDHLLEDADASC